MEKIESSEKHCFETGDILGAGLKRVSPKVTPTRPLRMWHLGIGSSHM